MHEISCQGALKKAIALASVSEHRFVLFTEVPPTEMIVNKFPSPFHGRWIIDFRMHCNDFLKTARPRKINQAALAAKYEFHDRVPMGDHRKPLQKCFEIDPTESFFE
jgi:hypothetical protein